MFRRRKRKTDWLFADTVVGALTFADAGGPSFSTLPFLPTEYVDQDAEGGCTLVRIVGDLYVYLASDTTIVTGPVLGATFSLLRTQVDDTGVVGQLEVDPYAAPGLGATASVGGARDFLWSKNFIWINGIAGGSHVPPYLPPFGQLQLPTFDVRVKRRLKTGEAIVLNVISDSDSTLGAANVTVNFVFTYRVLVALSTR